MFQSTTDINNNKNDFKEINMSRIKYIFTIQNIFIYILSFLLSTLSVKNELMPFGISIIAASVGESIPLIGIIISVFAGTFIGGGIKSLANTFFVSVLYLFMVLFINSKIAIEERNEKIKTGGKLFFSCFLVTLLRNCIGVFLLYDIFMGIINAAITYVFYKIFVNGLIVIESINEKKVFTIEELIAGSLIISLASLAFNGFTIFSLRISNIIIIFLIMLLGWQNGSIVGAVTGVSIGIASSIIDNTNIMQILMFTVSGVLSGTLNKFGKIGVILGFLLGNIIITYWIRGATNVVIYFKEILIASLGLLLVPKKFKIDIENILNKDKLIDNYGNNTLSSASSEDISERLKTISNLFSSFIEGQDLKEVNNTNIEEELLSNLDEIKNNMFYEEIKKKENGILKDVCLILMKNDILLDKDFIDILKRHNNYIFEQDEKTQNDIQEVVKIANKTLKVAQIDNVKTIERHKNVQAINEGIKNVTKVIDKCVDEIELPKENKYLKKEQEIELLLAAKNIKVNNCLIKQIENKKNIIEIVLDYQDDNVRKEKTIQEISNIISKSMKTKIVFQRERLNVDKKIYSQVYSNEDPYILQVGNSRVTKDGSNVSGDCSLQIKLADSKYLLAIADGIGSGEKAREYSKVTLRLIKQLFSAGFNKDDSINLVNSRLNLTSENDNYSTLDAIVLDLYVGEGELLKNGACATYVKNKNELEKISSDTMPLGINNKAQIQFKNITIHDGDIIVMCSDGVVDSKNDGGIWLENFIKMISINNVQKIADLILAEAIDNNYGIVKDDMTVIVSKIVKRKNI